VRRLPPDLQASLGKFEAGRVAMTKAPISIRMARQGVSPIAIQQVPLPSFGERVACRSSDSELFFSERAQDISLAKSICHSCPLIRACAEWAIRHEDYGVFGGLSAKERYLLRGAKAAISPQKQEIACQEIAYILSASAREVALGFGVETRTVARWRKLLAPMKEVV